MNLERRLAKLEDAIQSQTAASEPVECESDEAIQERWLASCIAILETMTEKHQSKIIEGRQGALLEWFYELAGAHFRGNSHVRSSFRLRSVTSYLGTNGRVRRDTNAKITCLVYLAGTAA